MVSCPHCHAKSIGVFQKLFATPLFVHRCANCGENWATSRWAGFLGVLAAVSFSTLISIIHPAPLLFFLSLGAFFVVLTLALILIPAVQR